MDEDDLLPIADGEPGAARGRTDALEALVIAQIAERHPGLTEESARHYAQAATVAIRRHHAGAVIWRVSAPKVGESYCHMSCGEADAVARRAHANRDDTTRDGAYAVAFVSVFSHLGLKVIRRAPAQSGADWLVAPLGAEGEIDDEELVFERPDLIRLEVSGVDADSEPVLLARLRRKVKQTHDGISLVDAALSAVVGFSSGTTLLSEVTRYGT